MWGLWSISQSRPRMTGNLGEGMTKKVLVSEWGPSWRRRGAVRTAVVRGRPSATSMWTGSCSLWVGMLLAATRVESMKQVVEPLSRRAEVVMGEEERSMPSLAGREGALRWGCCRLPTKWEGKETEEDGEAEGATEEGKEGGAETGRKRQSVALWWGLPQ
jgi:hypothetical protein